MNEEEDVEREITLKLIEFVVPRRAFLLEKISLLLKFFFQFGLFAEHRLEFVVNFLVRSLVTHGVLLQLLRMNF